MTASGVGAAPNTVDQLMQSVRTRVNAPRDGDKKGSDGKSDARDIYRDEPKSAAAENSRAAGRADKSQSRKQSDADADEGEASFADTIDSIGNQEPKNTAVGERNESWFQGTVDAAAAANNQIQQQTAEEPLASPQPPMRPVTLLRQDSIAALMDAKARLFPNTNGPDGAGGPVFPNQDLPLPQGAVEPTEPVVLSDTLEPTPATVNRQETHWNFNDRTIVAAAMQASELQPEEPAAPLAFSSPRPSASQAKSNDTSNGLLQTGQVQAVAVPATETAGDSFSGTQDQSQPRLQLAETADSRKVVKAEAADSSEQLSSVESKPSQNFGNVTAQVRNGVIDTLAGKSGALTPSTQAMGIRDHQPSPPPVLRSLDLTLTPPDLGTIRLRMTLKSNALEIEADASKAATAKILNDDRSSLERGLRDAGYDVTSLKVSDVSASSSTGANGQQTGGSLPRDAGDQARSNFAGNQDSNSQRRDGTSDEAQRRRQDQSQQQATAADSVTGRAGGAVYI